MSPEVFKFGCDFLAVAFCSAAVKLADDFLDGELDACVGKPNWAQFLGPGAMVYAMLFLAIAAGFNNALSLSLFLASYIVGMFNQLNLVFPSRLNGFEESIAAFLIGIWLFGFNSMLFSLCFIAAVQLFDDYIDCKKDKYTGQANLANKFGRVECLTASFIFLFGALVLNYELIWPALAGFGIVYFLSFLFEKPKSKPKGAGT